MQFCLNCLSSLSFFAKKPKAPVREFSHEKWILKAVFGRNFIRNNQNNQIRNGFLVPMYQIIFASEFCWNNEKDRRKRDCTWLRVQRSRIETRAFLPVFQWCKRPPSGCASREKIKLEFWRKREYDAINFARKLSKLRIGHLNSN